MQFHIKLRKLFTWPSDVNFTNISLKIRTNLSYCRVLLRFKIVITCISDWVSQSVTAELKRPQLLFEKIFSFFFYGQENWQRADEQRKTTFIIFKKRRQSSSHGGSESSGNSRTKNS